MSGVEGGFEARLEETFKLTGTASWSVVGNHPKPPRRETREGDDGDEEEDYPQQRQDDGQADLFERLAFDGRPSHPCSDAFCTALDREEEEDDNDRMAVGQPDEKLRRKVHELAMRAMGKGKRKRETESVPDFVRHPERWTRHALEKPIVVPGAAPSAATRENKKGVEKER